MSERILVIGDGKMGRAVAQVAVERGCDVVGMMGPADMARGLKAGVADVAIEFTEPSSAAANVRACLAIALPIVSGTTGWDAELAAVRAEAVRSTGAFMHAPNFSIGVAVFARLVHAAARLQAAFPSGAFDTHIIETHHAAKLDAPSGTAKMLARTARDAGDRDIPITSVRVGSVPGTHELVLDAPFEQIRLIHEARDRRVFADGAVAAARWLAHRQGVYTFEDYINERLK